MNTYTTCIINWYTDDEFSHTDEFAFDSCGDAAKYAESILNTENGPLPEDCNIKYDIIELKDTYREEEKP